ncbi:serine hydrolase [Sphingosinicella sp.]|uniref:serine hydrolase domain-containing protein n=1 Tax=Sphingosinicella sp. TaxID=1917971 RepID=UPI00261F11E6|nr:serine hydrolase domain-containing protein [Sphingosinicella sp.]
MKPSFAFLALAIASTPAHAVDLDAVRKVITDTRTTNAPGCVAGAFKAGKTLFITSAGMADVANAKPLDGDTQIYAASVSKQFTVLAAATLAVQGKIGLKDDIRKYLPELPQYEVPVTVEMLIHHTSGVRDWLALSAWAGASDFSTATKSQALDLLFRQKDTNFTPGTEFIYSNGGYLLLAEIIERVSGMPFSDYATKTILKPLGMKNSMFMNGARPTQGKVAHGYKPQGDGFEIRDTYPTISGSGGLMVTINDLAKFDHDIEVGHKVWTPEIMAIMVAPGRFTNGEPAVRKPSKQAYAGGLMVGERRGQYFVQHGGGAEAFKNQYQRLPEKKLGVAVFCNRSDWDPGEKADAVTELVEGAILTDETKPFNGRYFADELQATYDVSIDGRELTATVTSPYAKTGTSEKFTRSSDGTFRANGTVLTFSPDGSGFTLGTERVRAIPFKRLTND